MNVVLDKEANATMQSWKSSSKKKDRRSTVVDRIEETPVVGNLGKEPLRLRLVRGRRSALPIHSGTYVAFVVVRVQVLVPPP